VRRFHKKAAANANRAAKRLDEQPHSLRCLAAGTPVGSKTPVHPDDHINMRKTILTGSLSDYIKTTVISGRKNMGSGGWVTQSRVCS
jgi:hypothetical protein